jgi:hypothetical protein
MKMHQSEWIMWSWTSEGDKMLNGAFFRSSGSSRYDIKASGFAKSVSFVPRQELYHARRHVYADELDPHLFSESRHPLLRQMKYIAAALVIFDDPMQGRVASLLPCISLPPLGGSKISLSNVYYISVFSRQSMMDLLSCSLSIFFL